MSLSMVMISDCVFFIYLLLAVLGLCCCRGFFVVAVSGVAEVAVPQLFAAAPPVEEHGLRRSSRGAQLRCSVL